MADEKRENEPATAEEGAEQQPAAGRRFPVKRAGGVLALAATGATLALVALPRKAGPPRIEGPFFAALLEQAVPLSVIDNSNRRYVKIAVDAEFKAYDEAYVEHRRDDPFFAPVLRSQLEFAASGKSIKEITEGLNRETFAEELRGLLDPVVFPVHIGDTKLPLDEDPATGLRPGTSRDQATFRGWFHENTLHLDGPARELRIDEGPTVSFEGHEEDLRVETAQGEHLFVDVTHYDEEFVGDVPIGVRGRLRRLILHDMIAQ